MRSYKPNSIDDIASQAPKRANWLTRGISTLMLYTAMGLGIAAYGCDDAPVDGDADGDVDGDVDGDADGDSDGDGDADANVPPGAIDEGSYSGPNGETYIVGDRLDVQFTVPSGDDLEAAVTVTADTDGVEGPSDGDDVFEYDIGSVDEGDVESVSVNTGIDNDGGPFPASEEGIDYTVELVVSNPHGQSTLTREFTLETEEVNPVSVTGCNVLNSNVGNQINISCVCDAPNPADVVGNWNVSGGPDSIDINNFGLLYSSASMQTSDVAFYTYTVTCSDGTFTSPDYTFRAPVDEHRSVLYLRCAETGVATEFLLPEDVVDTLATECGEGFNESNKPSAAGEDPYPLPLDHTLVLDSLAGLHPDAQEDITHYNNGTTPEDHYSSCTVDQASVEYTHN